MILWAALGGACAAGEPADLFVAGEGGYQAYREPALAVLRDGSVLVVCEARRIAGRESADVDLVWRRGPSGGAVWSDPQVLRVGTAAPGAAWGSPCLVAEPDGSAVHLLYTLGRETAWATVTRDGGRTWAEPEELTGAFGEFPYPVSKLSTGPGHGVALSDGALVVPVWVQNERLVHEVPEIDMGRYRAGVLRRRPAGPWEAGGLVGPWLRHLRAGSLAEVRPGLLLYHLRGGDLGLSAQTTSGDGGIHWERPKLAAQLPCSGIRGAVVRRLGPDGAARLLATQTVAAEPPPGDPAAPEDAGGVSTEAEGAAGVPDPPAESGDAGAEVRSTSLVLYASADGGATWREERTLHRGPSGASDLGVDADGTVWCVFEAGQAGPGGTIRLMPLERGKDGPE